MITVSLSPNVEPDDVVVSLKMLFTPWTWRKDNYCQSIKAWFKMQFGFQDIQLFGYGRTALWAILKSFQIGEGDEVIIQAFACVVVPNSIKFLGAKPIYADIDKTLNLDPYDLKAKITDRTKAIIVQHTFGIPANMDEILQIAHKYKIPVIEDCAHSLGATYKGRLVGTLGDAAMFSFGRDKIISSVFGGAAFINSKFRIQNAELKKIHNTLKQPPKWWIMQQLFHPIAFSIILPLYDVFNVGKFLLVLFQKIHLVSFPIDLTEKQGRQPKQLNYAYSNALAGLLIHQLSKLQRFNKQRQKIARYYYENLRDQKHTVSITGSVFLRFPIFHESSIGFIKEARRKKILLGNWYHSIIDPQGIDLSVVDYKKGMCPRAEIAAAQIVNLPTRIKLDDAKKVITLWK